MKKLIFCSISVVTIILISNVALSIASTHDEHDSHDEHNSHESKDVFDLLHHELGGKNESFLTSSDLVKLYNGLNLKMCTSSVQSKTKADDGCNTVS